MLPLLHVSPNRRFLVDENNVPFFWMGDTAWELFHRLNREQAELYLQNRKSKGYNVIQAVALAELDGLRTPNAYGDLPLIKEDPLRPNEAYFEHIDWVIRRANSMGMYVALLPTWGDKWNQRWGVGPEIFTQENAGPFGEWIGRRYKDDAIIWIVGGDRGPDHDGHIKLIREMAEGLRRGDEARHLISMHPWAGHGSSNWFHGVDYLDFNMRQNGHTNTWPRYAQTRDDYDLEPPVPVIDAEPLYEGHPINFSAKEFGYSIAKDIRQTFYWSVFCGGFGYTYGHHSIWQFWTPEHKPINGPIMTWLEALDEPGSSQIIHGRRLMESRPMLTRIPDDSLIIPTDNSLVIPGTGNYRFTATRDSEGRYAMIYAPIGRPFSVQLNLLKGPDIQAWWFNPRTGESSKAGNYSNTQVATFLSPNPGEDLDWVLVLDQASMNFPPPGKSDSTADFPSLNSK